MWEHPDAVLATLQTGGIGAASVAAAGGLAYAVLTRERRELMREWVGPLHQALAVPLGIAEQTDPRPLPPRPEELRRRRGDTHRPAGVLAFFRDVVADLIANAIVKSRSGPSPACQLWRDATSRPARRPGSWR
ncbi:hypothetical protein GCM10010320_71830 [Streptomyces caelestis]|nr:hypothetical protein GCM10010320_71830 [Streptomyces caelestis]